MLITPPPTYYFIDSCRHCRHFHARRCRRFRHDSHYAAAMLMLFMPPADIFAEAAAIVAFATCRWLLLMPLILR